MRATHEEAVTLQRPTWASPGDGQTDHLEEKEPSDARGPPCPPPKFGEHAERGKVVGGCDPTNFVLHHQAAAS